MRVVDLLTTGRRSYGDVDTIQRNLHADLVAGRGEPALVLCELDSVYTAGRRTAPWDRIDPTLDVIDIDRGGRITWHGPGQIVAYPIIRLTTPLDVVAYVRALEAAVLDTLADVGITGDRVAGRSGVWLHEPERKICAIGVRVARGVTLHGIALNVANSLEPYRAIVPCGISDAGVTTMNHEAPGLFPPASLPEVAAQLATHLTARLAPLSADPLIKEVV